MEHFVEVGDSYQWFKRTRMGERIVACHRHPFSARELRTYGTGKTEQLRELVDNFDASGFETPSELKESLDEIASQARAYADEYTAGVQNMAEAFPNGSGQLEAMTATAEALEAWADELDGIDAGDDVAPVAGQLHPVLDFHRFGTRLGELAGQAADLDHRAGGAEGQDHGHLQQHAEGIADIVGMKFGETFRAVAALQEESLAVGDSGQGLFQAPGLAGEDQRRITAQAFFRRRQCRRVRILGRLLDGFGAPTLRRPFDRHGLSLSPGS